MAGTSFTVAGKLINSLDSFPRNEKRRALWLYFLRLHNDQDLELQDVHRICGLHFPGGDFIANTNTLNEAANPSIFGAATQRRASELWADRLSDVFHSIEVAWAQAKLMETSLSPHLQYAKKYGRSQQWFYNDAAITTAIHIAGSTSAEGYPNATAATITPISASYIESEYIQHDGQAVTSTSHKRARTTIVKPIIIAKSSRISRINS